MKGYGDEMAAAGRPIEEEELVEYILTGKNHEFESLVSALVTRVEPISLDDLYSQLLYFETRMELIHGGDQSSANMAGRSCGHGRGSTRGCGRGNSGGGRGRSSDSNMRQGSQGSYTNKRVPNNERPLCQVCLKRGHVVTYCWHRFDEDYVPEERHISAAATSYGVDTNWYTNTGSTDHITSNLEKLSATISPAILRS